MTLLGNGSGTAVQLITTQPALEQFLATDPRPPALVVGLELTAIEADVVSADLAGVCFLGCAASAEFPARVSARRGTFLPSLDGPPVPVFPDRLYRVRDLYAGFDPAVDGSWHDTPDSRARSWFMGSSTRKPRVLPPHEFWAARTHDSFIESAITAFRAQVRRPAVGVMGGHDVPRTADVYRTVAVVARALTRAGKLIVTGGGPGLMEAANLGAFLAPSLDDDALDDALRTLRRADDFTSHGWLQTAATVRADVLGAWDALEPAGATSLGIPTWLYGHEPPNMFASHSAKFFFNSLREDGLVTLADGGLIFAEGNAGTVQEIFQDATQNYYRGDDAATPMILLGRAHWDRDSTDPGAGTGTVATPKSKPLWPLLRQLAAEKGFGSAITLTDDPDEIIARLTQQPPAPAPTLARPRVG